MAVTGIVMGVGGLVLSWIMMFGLSKVIFFEDPAEAAAAPAAVTAPAPAAAPVAEKAAEPAVAEVAAPAADSAAVAIPADSAAKVVVDSIAK